MTFCLVTTAFGSHYTFGCYVFTQTPYHLVSSAQHSIQSTHFHLPTAHFLHLGPIGYIVGTRKSLTTIHFLHLCQMEYIGHTRKSITTQSLLTLLTHSLPLDPLSHIHRLLNSIIHPFSHIGRSYHTILQRHPAIRWSSYSSFRHSAGHSINHFTHFPPFCITTPSPQSHTLKPFYPFYPFYPFGTLKTKTNRLQFIRRLPSTKSQSLYKMTSAIQFYILRLLDHTYIPLDPNIHRHNRHLATPPAAHLL